jgi:hypothetical protein
VVRRESERRSSGAGVTKGLCATATTELRRASHIRKNARRVLRRGRASLRKLRKSCSHTRGRQGQSPSSTVQSPSVGTAARTSARARKRRGRECGLF